MPTSAHAQTRQRPAALVALTLTIPPSSQCKILTNMCHRDEYASGPLLASSIAWQCRHHQLAIPTALDAFVTPLHVGKMVSSEGWCRLCVRHCTSKAACKGGAAPVLMDMAAARNRTADMRNAASRVMLPGQWRSPAPPSCHPGARTAPNAPAHVGQRAARPAAALRRRLRLSLAAAQRPLQELRAHAVFLPSQPLVNELLADPSAAAAHRKARPFIRYSTRGLPMITAVWQ